MNTAFSDEMRQILAGVADIMIPAEAEAEAEAEPRRGGGRLPCASDVGVHTTRLDAVLRQRPDLAAPLLHILHELKDMDPAEAFAALDSGTVAGMDVIGLVVGFGYLRAPQIDDLLGYHGQQDKTVDPGDVVAALHEGLLDPVLERGPFFRPTPEPSVKEPSVKGELR